MELNQYSDQLAMISGYLWLAITAVDGVRRSAIAAKRWWDGEFAPATSILTDAQEKQVSGVLGWTVEAAKALGSLLMSLAKGLSGFNTKSK